MTSTDLRSDAPMSIEAFTFGDATSVIDGRDLWGYFEGLWRNADWYEPPVPMRGLAKAYRMSPHHQSAITLKVNQLKRHFIPSRWLDMATFEWLALDFLQMGNLYAEVLPNLAGKPLRLKRSPAIQTRVGVEPGRFFFIDPARDAYAASSAHEFARGSVIHIFEPDPEQEVYGLPQWMSALQSGLLNENATLFRRRYYLNGAHAGFVFYLSEPTVSMEDADAVRQALKSAKGIGNFKNLFIHAANGKKDGVQIIPISEVAAKDEFVGIKNITRDDLLAAHRVPPQLIGIIPTNNGGFGDIRSAMDVFFSNEIAPLMVRLEQINEQLGVPAVSWRPYERMMTAG